MDDIDRQIEVYQTLQADLELHESGKWVVIHDRTLAGIYESLDKAAEDAVRRFGRGPYLIREVGGPPPNLPASVLYRPYYGPDKLRIR